MFYQKVTEYCNNNNISIHAFEKMCGIANGTVSCWKDGKSNPSIPTLNKIVSATGVPAEEWLK